jgi:hypothetical protein
MADKTILYSKQSGEPRVPITVRIEWRPDGTIIPCLYWTPDGSCYEIKHIYDMVHLAHLKDRGEGARFKVRSELIETPEPYSDYLFTSHETYLYFSDNWFCGKPFIDGRYGHERKEFIHVILDVFPDCKYEIVYFTAQGKQYAVEKTIAIEPRGSFDAGGIGVWHKVKAAQVNLDDDYEPGSYENITRMAALYFEINKWFIVIKPKAVID